MFHDKHILLGMTFLIMMVGAEDEFTVTENIGECARLCLDTDCFLILYGNVPNATPEQNCGLQGSFSDQEAVEAMAAISDVEAYANELQMVNTSYTSECFTFIYVPIGGSRSLNGSAASAYSSGCPVLIVTDENSTLSVVAELNCNAQCSEGDRLCVQTSWSSSSQSENASLCINDTSNHSDGTLAVSATGDYFILEVALNATSTASYNIAFEACTDQCVSPCSVHCRGPDDACDPIDGTCYVGCDPGYLSDTCNETCSEGYYGQDCLEECSDQCAIENNCDHVDGSCECKAGYQPPVCKEECAAGTYGEKCTQTCSEHCAGGNHNCDHVSGSCDAGCEPGYQHPFCVEECAEGTYGDGCLELCSPHCSGDGTCNPINGTCEHGCSAGGYVPPLCLEECSYDHYGQNCEHTCGDYCASTDVNGHLCDIVTGVCFLCQAGHMGDFCEQVCPRGLYGPGCTAQCSPECPEEGGVRSCSHIDGACYYKDCADTSQCGEETWLFVSVLLMGLLVTSVVISVIACCSSTPRVSHIQAGADRTMNSPKRASDMAQEVVLRPRYRKSLNLEETTASELELDLYTDVPNEYHTPSDHHDLTVGDDSRLDYENGDLHVTSEHQFEWPNPAFTMEGVEKL